MRALHASLFVAVLATAPLSIACKDDEDPAPTETTVPPDDTPAPTPMAGSAAEPLDEPMDIVDTAVAAGDFTRLAAALGSADLVDTLKGEGPFTVFAPTDDAFEAFEAANPGVIAGLSTAELTAILSYHVIAGAAVESGDLVDASAAVTVSGSPVLFDLSDGAAVRGGAGTLAKVTTADIEASNGVIHVIDAILLPPPDDLVDTAIAAGDFALLAAALTAQDLVGTLKGEGPFTVFAPTDAAFAALGAVPSGDALTDVLLYHVVEGAIGSGNLAAGAVEMLSGDSVTVSLADGVGIDDASVTTADILTKNGIIHVIDAVLVP